MTKQNDTVANVPADTGRGWRYKIGLAMFILPVVSMILTPLIIPLLGLSAANSAALIGGFLVGGELIWFASIPFLGKEGFNQIKSKLFGALKLTDKPIGRVRHSWGMRLVGGALLFQGLVLIWIVVGYFYLGSADVGTSIGGASFAQEASFFAFALVASAAAFFVGIWLLGGRFVSRLNAALVWQEDA